MQRTANAQPRWLLALFVALALLQLLPVWSVRHLPTCDGPAHLYNSWILRELLSGNNGPIARIYAVDWRPHPNWISHAALALLMGIVSPIVAEKLLFSAIVLLFLASMWMYAGAADPSARSFAFLALPFAFHRFLQLGFYNFSLSIALHFMILAVWWRRRDRPNVKTISGVAALLLLCYFTHPLSTVLAIAAIGVLWVLTLHGRSLAIHARHLLAFIPVLPLLVWFVVQRGSAGTPNSGALFERLFDLVRIRALLTFDYPWQFTLGVAVFILLIVLAVATMVVERRRREADAFLALTAIMIVIYFGAPEVFAGGDIPLRIPLFIYLLPLPWLSVPRRWRVTIVALLSLVTLINVGFLVRRYREVDGQLTELIRSVDLVAPQTSLLPLMFKKEPPRMSIAALWHTVDYVAIEKQLVDLDNFEPDIGYFPIKFQSDVQPINFHSIQATPGEIDVAAFASRAQYVFTWDMPPGVFPLEQQLPKYYELVSESGKARLYRRLVTYPP